MDVVLLERQAQDAEWAAGLARDRQEGRYVGPLAGPEGPGADRVRELYARARREPLEQRFHHTY